jgi:putative endonuclease
MVKLVYTYASGAYGSNAVRVRVSLSPHNLFYVIPDLIGDPESMYKEKIYYVYILASKKNGTLYIGVTDNLIKRSYQHRNNLVEGFTKKYNIHKLVYYETTNNIQAALSREKQLKKWNRVWKIALIEKENPEWKDLAEEYYKDAK